MVKDLLAFIRWNLTKLTWHNYVSMLAGGLISNGWLNDNDMLLHLGVAIIVIMSGSLLINYRWQVWKQERKDLFEKIKGE